MSSKTLIDTLKAVTGELALPQPTVVLSSPVLTDIQLRQLAVAAGEDLLDAHDWQALFRKHSFTITADTSYPLPADFHRMLNQTFWIGTNELDGAPSPARWTRLESGEKRFRIVGDRIQVSDSAPMQGQTASFNYISKYFILDGGNGMPKAEFSLDSDKTVYHARLYTNLVKLKFLQAKGLDSRGTAEDYNAVLGTAIGADSPAPVLWMDGEPDTVWID